MVGSESPWVSLAIALFPLTLLAGFVQSHRYPESLFARVWVGTFTALIVVGGVVAKVGMHFTD